MRAACILAVFFLAVPGDAQTVTSATATEAATTPSATTSTGEVVVEEEDTTTYAADLEQDTAEYLSNATLNPESGAFTIVGWFRPEVLPAAGGLYGNDLAPDRDWACYSDATGRVFYGGFVSGAFKTGNIAAAFSNGTWAMGAFAYDGAQTVKFSIDAAAYDTTDMGGAMDTDNPLFTLGRIGSSEWDGLIAWAGLWSAELGAPALAALYANGPDITYSDLTAGQKINLVSWWDLEEEEGVQRDDSHGANHLTDNNTVGQAEVVYP